MARSKGKESITHPSSAAMTVPDSAQKKIDDDSSFPGSLLSTAAVLSGGMRAEGALCGKGRKEGVNWKWRQVKIKL